MYEKRLREVFDPTALEFNAILARLSVLFEDLRIEEYASRLDGLEQLDDIGKGYRKIYFLRRSIATLVEFASAIEMIDQRPEFRKLKKDFNADCTSRWDEAVDYFSNWKGYLSEIRADFGGHFDHESARHAIEEMHPKPTGELVVVKHTEEATGGVRLKYAMEIVGAAMTRRKPADQEDRAYFHEMFVVVRTASQMAVKAVHIRSTFDLVADFAEAEATGARRALVQHLTRVDLLVLEDFGMKTLGSTAAEDLLEVFVRRHEAASTLITTNRPTQDWGVFLGDVPATTAILDRFLAHAEIVPMT